MIYKLINAGTIIDLIDIKTLAEEDTSELFNVHSYILFYELKDNVTVHAAYNDDSTELLGILINSFVDTLWFEHQSYVLLAHRSSGVFTFMFDSHIRLAHEAGCNTYQTVSTADEVKAWTDRGYPIGTKLKDGLPLWEAAINGPLKTDLVWDLD